MNNSIKTQLQQKEFNTLKGRQRVLLQWATGCGKSKMAIDLINYTVGMLPFDHTYKILFVVAERAHINNWKQEWKKWHLSSKATSEIVCYNSLHKVDKEYDVIVFDEAHHMFTEKRLGIIETLKASYIYLLSATLSANKKAKAESIFGKFTTSTITLNGAIQNSILPDPKVYVVAMELDDKRIKEEIRINKANESSPVVDWENRGKYIYKKKPCIIRCTERQKYLYYTDLMDYWKQRYELSRNQFHHNIWVNLGSQRKRFLGELKTEAVYRLTDRLAYKRYVCFCASIAQATMLSNNAISSKKGDRKNQYIINSFNSKRINNIYAVGMITEGMNLTDIQVGIITQLDGKERLFIQKFGRAMRAEDPVAFIFYYKNTQDENYLKKALENIDPKFVKYTDVKQLKTIKL